MSVLTLMTPTGSPESLFCGPDPTLLSAAVEESDTIRRVKIPHKEPCLSPWVLFEVFCALKVLLFPSNLLRFMHDSSLALHSTALSV